MVKTTEGLPLDGERLSALSTRGTSSGPTLKQRSHTNQNHEYPLPTVAYKRA